MDSAFHRPKTSMPDVEPWSRDQRMKGWPPANCSKFDLTRVSDTTEFRFHGLTRSVRQVGAIHGIAFFLTYP